ncbi:MAG: tyrosine recombinase XerC [Candidatus Thiodiazotropha sp. (ex Lucinoma borealis)]|nr:tyrosine recombinase XerC [Candidatus Thiodiazotropha sp. (ex Lucinoma borealis)]
MPMRIVTSTRPSVVALTDSYIAYIMYERCLSAHTISCYRRDLAHFAVWLEWKGIDDLSQIAPRDVFRYVGLRRRHGLSDSSLQRELSCIRSFYRYLQRECIVEENPAKSARVPRSPRKLPTVLSHEEVSLLLSFPGNTPEIIRDRAILELFYSSGLRLDELLKTNLNNLDLRERLIVILGKGKKTRYVPIGSHAVQAIQAWIQFRIKMANARERALFVGMRGKRISRSCVQRLVSKWAKKQGIIHPVSPHTLRHTFATHLLASSGNLRAIQEMLGHVSITTTQIYTHLDFSHLAKVYKKTHPRAYQKKASCKDNGDAEARSSSPTFRYLN